MTKKYFIICLSIIASVILGTIYLIKGSPLETKYSEVSINRDVDKIIKRVDNKRKFIDLITIKYSQTDVTQYLRYGRKIEEVDKHFPIECLRKAGNKYYSIHLLKEGGAFFSLFIYDEEDKTYKVRDFWLYNNELYKNQFDNLVIGKSTFDDVKGIDKDSSTFITSMDTYSFHKTIDGYAVNIKYEGNEKHLIVSEILISKCDEYSVYPNLLPIDSPLSFVK